MLTGEVMVNRGSKLMRGKLDPEAPGTFATTCACGPRLLIRICS
jgi:hypothetical protein